MNKNLMNKNVGQIDQYARIGIGGLLIFLALLGVIGEWGWLGILPLATGFLRTCPAYTFLGINTDTTAAATGEPGQETVAEAPAPVKESITEAPVQTEEDAAKTSVPVEAAVTEVPAPVEEAIAEAPVQAEETTVEVPVKAETTVAEAPAAIEETVAETSSGESGSEEKAV